jgi:hypothetical protein
MVTGTSCETILHNFKHSPFKFVEPVTGLSSGEPLAPRLASKSQQNNSQ